MIREQREGGSPSPCSVGPLAADRQQQKSLAPGVDGPVVSTLNAADGWITSNMAVVPTVNGKIDAYAAGLTQLILDISSYFAP